MLNRRTIFALALCCLGAFSVQARAHFIWLLPESTDGGMQVQVYFSEDATPDDPMFLRYVEGVQILRVRAGEEPVPVAIERTDDAVFAPVSDDDFNNCVFITTRDLGVMTRGDAVFRGLREGVACFAALTQSVLQQAALFV